MPYIIMLGYVVISKKTELMFSVFTRKTFLTFFFFQTVFWLVAIFTNHYSLFYKYDTSWYTNVLSNFSNGHGFYTSVYQIPQLADHFCPNILLLSPLFYFSDSSLWIILARWVCFVWSIWLLYRLCREYRLEDSVMYFILILWMINSKTTGFMRFDFHPSNLSVPFIFLLFLLWKQKKYILAYVCLFFLLGFKTQMSIVWVSFGFFQIFIEKKYLIGVITSISGIVLGYFLIYVLTPQLTGMVNVHAGEVNPFLHILLKISVISSFMMVTGFVPLLNWRYLFLVGPALGLTILSGLDWKINLGLHYADVPITLVYVTMVLIFSQWETLNEKIKTSWMHQLWFIAFSLGVLIHCQTSASYFVFSHLPNDKTIAAVSSAEKFANELDGTKNIWVQDNLGPLITKQYKFRILTSEDRATADTLSHYVVLTDVAKTWPFEDRIGEVIQKFETLADSGKYQRINGYFPLRIYLHEAVGKQ